MTDNQILSALMKWKKENRFRAIDLQVMLGMQKHTYHRRINNGGWTLVEIETMKEAGVFGEEK